MAEQIEYDGNDRIEIACSYDSIDEMLDALKK